MIEISQYVLDIVVSIGPTPRAPSNNSVIQHILCLPVTLLSNHPTRLCRIRRQIEKSLGCLANKIVPQSLRSVQCAGWQSRRRFQKLRFFSDIGSVARDGPV
jgi:hypothetical protein